MKFRIYHLIAVFIFFTGNTFAQDQLSLDSCGYSVKYYKRKDLAVVPVMINDTLVVHMVLDPRCKTVVLFGKRFEKLLRSSQKLNGGSEMRGELFSKNKITIGPTTRTNVSIAVVPNRDPMNFILSINGVMGYDFLEDFHIVRDEKKQIMSFIPIERDEAITMAPKKISFQKP